MNEIIDMNRRYRGAAIYSKKKKELEIRVWASCKNYNIKPVEGKVSLIFTWYEPNKKRDFDNIAAGKKFIIDGLVSSSILKRDTQKVIEGFSDFFGHDPQRPRIEVVIIPIRP